MGKAGNVDAMVDDHYVLLKASLTKLVAAFEDKTGWWYPLL
jgi:hypothetical protein